VIAVDTNILVYAHREDSAWHDRAVEVIRTLAEGGPYWERLTGLVRAARVHGPKIQDARIAALCLVGGASELLSADRDFGQFPELRVRNPLVG
jgi:predicted nucleic acid-binding protein